MSRKGEEKADRVRASEQAAIARSYMALGGVVVRPPKMLGFASPVDDVDDEGNAK